MDAYETIASDNGFLLGLFSESNNQEEEDDEDEERTKEELSDIAYFATTELVQAQFAYQIARDRLNAGLRNENAELYSLQTLELMTDILRRAAEANMSLIHALGEEIFQTVQEDAHYMQAVFGADSL